MARIKMMALRHSAFYAPFLMTISGGYLKKEGLEPDYQPQTPGNLVSDAFRKDRCDVAQSAVAVNFAALEAGKEPHMVHFAQINERDGFFIAAREPDENFSWDKLAGKDVLVDHFFQPLAMLKYGLHKQGVGYEELNAIDAGDVAQMDNTFRNGVGQYVHQQGPAPQQLEEEGLGHVVAAVGDAVGPVAFSSICSSREWLETEMASAFMHAYQQAREFVIEAPAEDTAKFISHHLPDIDIKVLTRTIAVYQKLGNWSPHVDITEDAYNNLLEVFLHSGDITKRHNMSLSIAKPPAT